MAFEAVTQLSKPFSRINAPRYSIVTTPTMRVGRVKLPAAFIELLTWKEGTELQVLAGTDDDVGWYGLRPAALNSTERKLRAKLKIRENGVGEYQTQALVPKELSGPVNTREPEFRVEGNQLFIKLF
jgi:hypothetical protein